MRAINTLTIVGDFENTKVIHREYKTTTGKIKREYKTHIWASCFVDVETNRTLALFNNIDDTMNFLFDNMRNNNIELYYHNLKYDIQFIISWLLENGFTYSYKLDKKKSFNTIITTMGQYYQLQLKLNKGKNAKKLTIRDSLKILNLPVSQLARAYDLSFGKGELDYNKYRGVNHVITDEEKDYIERDCKVVAKCLKITFDNGFRKMTSSSNAMESFKEIMGKKYFKYHYPILDMPHSKSKVYGDNGELVEKVVTVDDFIRESYKGGYTYVNPKMQNKVINKRGRTYDVTSLYPWAMRDETHLFPYGMPLHYKGKYEENKNYPLYIQRIRCFFKVKKGYIPIVQVKSKGSIFNQTEYLESSKGVKVTLTLTNIDLELFLKHYDVSMLEYIEGYMFKGESGVFNEYIDYWIKIKEESSINGNEGMRTIAKLMLNSLYGKFCSSTDNRVLAPFMDGESGIVNYEIMEGKSRHSVYTAMGSFITAYSRRKSITAYQENYKHGIACYMDTDSLHVIGDKVYGIEIHDTKLGAWKIESEWIEAKFIRAKTYYEEVIDFNSGELKLDVKCAGLPKECRGTITKNNFKVGAKFFGKLVPVRCKGGVVLEERYFTIK